MGSNRAIIVSITNVSVLTITQLKIIRLFWKAIGATDLGHRGKMQERITGQKQYFLHVPSEEKVTKLRHPDFWQSVAQVDSKTIIIRKEK